MARTALCFIAVLAFLGTPLAAETLSVTPGDTVTVSSATYYIFYLTVESQPSDTSSVIPGIVAPIFYALGHTKPQVGTFDAVVDGSAPREYEGMVLRAPVVVERHGRDPDTLAFYIRVSGSSDVGAEAELPTEFALHQNYPNPFNPATTIQYDLPQSANVRLSLYNTLGQEVLALIDEHQAAGTHRYTLSAHALPSGTYYYHLTANNISLTKKLVILK